MSSCGSARLTCSGFRRVVRWLSSPTTPTALLDGAVLAVLLARVRQDVKVMTNFLLEGVPELEQSCIFVDPLHTADPPNEIVAHSSKRWSGCSKVECWRSFLQGKCRTGNCSRE